MNFKYLFGSLFTIPLLPLLYLHGKRIKKYIPDLPEAKNPSGLIKHHSQKVLNLICLGESTIAGVGVDTHANGFAGSLAKELSIQMNCQVDWRVLARSGYTAKKITQKLVPKMEKANYDLIVIGLGGNDAFTLNSPRNWKKDIGKLIQKIRERFPETPIYFTNMPPIKDFPAFSTLIKITVGNLVELLGQELNDLTEEFDDVFYNHDIIRLYDWIDKLVIYKPMDFFSDGVHPSPLTYEVWGKEMASFITINSSRDFLKNIESR